MVGGTRTASQRTRLGWQTARMMREEFAIYWRRNLLGRPVNENLARGYFPAAATEALRRVPRNS